MTDGDAVLPVEPLAGFDPRALRVDLPRPLGELRTGPGVAALLRPAAADGPPPPFLPAPDLHKAVRDVLRQRGYRPTGRGKPSSEYLEHSVAEGRLPAINAAVDLCNAASCHSGLPISVVDVARLQPPARIAVAGAGARYVFNASGQEIEVAGLPCLFDAAGPCANAVKDAQRTKTTAATRALLVVVWGVSTAAPERPGRVADWLRSGFVALGAAVTAVPVAAAAP